MSEKCDGGKVGETRARAGEGEFSRAPIGWQETFRPAVLSTLRESHLIRRPAWGDAARDWRGMRVRAPRAWRPGRGPRARGSGKPGAVGPHAGRAHGQMVEPHCSAYCAPQAPVIRLPFGHAFNGRGRAGGGGARGEWRGTCSHRSGRRNRQCRGAARPRPAHSTLHPSTPAIRPGLGLITLHQLTARQSP